MNMTGPLSEAALGRFYADVCVIGSAGLDPAIGMTEMEPVVASQHRMMMDRSRRVLMLADHSKLGFRAPCVVGPAQHIDTLVTDEAAPEPMLELHYANMKFPLCLSAAESLLPRRSGPRRTG